MKFIYITFFLLLTGISQSKSLDSVLIYDDPSSIKTLDYNIFILEDRLSNISFHDIQTNSNFKPSKSGLPNLGISSYTYWIKFSIYNNTSTENLLLQLSAPLLDTAYLFFTDQNGVPVEIQLGNNQPFKNRKYKNQNFIYDIHIKQNQLQTFYLKIHGNEQITLPLTLGSPEVINAENSLNDILVGIYAGIIIVMFFYNLFIYFTIRDKSYLIYVLYIFSIGLTQIVIPGYGFKLFWPEWYVFNKIATTFFASLGAIFAIEFLKTFVKTAIHTPTLHTYLSFFEIIFILAPLINIAGYWQLSFSIVQLSTLFLCLLIFFIAIKISLKRFRPAIFFLIAWALLMLSAIIFITKDLGIIPHNFFTKYSMQLGSSLEVVLLSFALADRINILKKEKEESQALALEALMQNELIIKNQNTLLENKVEERTKELKNINNELSATIADLKQTQSQLISSEKMASLGNLTAGIAHEINNPINFVVSNVKPLKKDIEDIYELIQKYENLDPINDFQNKIAEINSFRKEIDYAYLKNEIGSLLKGIEDGAGKTADIVHGLTAYSKVDENNFKRADIIEGLNSSLTLLNQEITGAKIELIKMFSPLPHIECFPGKLNQVFMNIVNNSIHAIKENSLNEKGQIIITTTFDNYKIHISIKDNGVGMTDETKERIFEPFFSTKEIGKGAGLGMSIAFSIIAEHNGNIQFLSEYGKGTECIISLPINYTSK